ncbi:HEXXH motif-containing putative peptide modification protein [Actinoplanes oblitus]|uniref:HEXXH motif-containing putative peptide modification protein n=1 Tax=Actinoplanes oblitus TaxID=3040509 RepID=A0ABY8WJ35_9ACTN|nr:HEXXH motif-containing putative peptide modification protein [Actinoplanes oblitus]WIM97427.1 HEXXH motif-containing putative peptide modification protein [Actinoplanes oblitus]
MRQFRLADADLAALGAGRPSADTLALLRRARLSRHLLLLREARRAVPEDPFWYAHLRALPADQSRQRAADPMTGLWAARLLAARRAGVPPTVGELPEPAGHLLVTTHAGRTLRVRLDDRGPLRHLIGLPPAEPLDPAGLAHWRRCLDAAWRILVDRHPAAAGILGGVLRVIVPARPDPLAEGVSATSAEAFGAVAMSAPASGTGLAVALLHETQHSVLNAAHGLFPLVAPGADRSYSPWREDPRPVFGILHGIYAFLAVTRFWRAELRAAGAARGIGEAGPATRDAGEQGQAAYDAGEQGQAEFDARDGGPAAPGVSEAEFEFARWRVAVHETAGRLLGGGALTPAGARVVAALRDEVAPWLAEPVDPEVDRLAGLARADHRARWRLRNLTVPPGDAAALAAAWRAGQPPPAVEATVARTERVVESSPRLRLIRALLRDEPERAALDGDDACLRGSHGAALRAYRKALLTDRSREAAWSGLALVSPHRALRDRPEIVRAAALAAPEADIADLAAWLSG